MIKYIKIENKDIINKLSNFHFIVIINTNIDTI